MPSPRLPTPSLQPPLRLIVMGSGPFAAPMFRALYGTRHSVLALVTQPTRGRSGKNPPPPNPMRAVAEEHGTQVLDPESVNTDEAREQLRTLAPDLFVVADYGQILKPETLAVARLGGVNLHGSLLPKYRGAAPINWALYNGDTETGVTVIHMTPRVDAGPMIAKASTPIDPDEDAVALEHRLAELGAPLICDVIDRLALGPVEPLPQDATQATPARRLRKSDSDVDWQRTALEIKNQVRALEPWPRTHASWQRKHGEPMRLILRRVSVDGATSDAEPGTIVEVSRQHAAVATGGGRLLIEEVQIAGKRAMSIGEFMNGHPLSVGDRFV